MLKLNFCPQICLLEITGKTTTVNLVTVFNLYLIPLFYYRCMEIYDDNYQKHCQL